MKERNGVLEVGRILSKGLNKVGRIFTVGSPKNKRLNESIWIFKVGRIFNKDLNKFGRMFMIWEAQQLKFIKGRDELRGWKEFQ